jgi:hypothetical protein
VCFFLFLCLTNFEFDGGCCQATAFTK